MDIFEKLLRQVRADWSGKGYDYLSVGIYDGSSKLSEVTSHYATERIASTVYVVYWPQDAQVRLPETSRPTHLEVATL
ncbi:MAG TPA: hypothetical protein VKR06_28695 [Ktedonosporobacter sp.]|nr:hypothetical protein [Ktedonosporobacter sp.]